MILRVPRELTKVISRARGKYGDERTEFSVEMSDETIVRLSVSII